MLIHKKPKIIPHHLGVPDPYYYTLGYLPLYLKTPGYINKFTFPHLHHRRPPLTEEPSLYYSWSDHTQIRLKAVVVCVECTSQPRSTCYHVI